MPFSFDASNNLNVALVGSTPVVSENLASVGGTNITLGAKASASSLPVVLATDEASLPVTLPAGQAVELLDSGGTNKASISAAGAVKVDGSAVTQPVSGTITANAGTGTFAENLTQIAGQSIGLAATGVQKVGIVGAGANSFETTAGVLDTNIKNVGNAALTLGAKTSANSIPVVLASDEANVPVIGAQGAISTTTWTSATPGSTSLQINCSGYGSVVLFFVTTGGTFTAGTLRFLASITGGNSCDVTGTRLANTSTPQAYDASNTYNLAPSVSWMYVFPVSGFDFFTVLLSNAIIGTGSVTLELRATAQLVPGPTTVGQSDATKLNATVTIARAASSFTVGNPASGSDFNIVIGATGLLQTFRGRFTASAAAANRNMNFILQDASNNTLYAQQMAFNIAANGVVDFYMGLALPLSTVVNAGGQAYLPIPQIVVQNGWKITVNTVAIQAGDLWSGLGYSIETS